MTIKIATKENWSIKPMPANPVVLDFDIFVKAEFLEALKAGYIPKEMEEKWFIYFEDNKLYFHRSWTGYLVFIVSFKEFESGLRSDKIEINSNTEQFEVTDVKQTLIMVENMVANLIVKNQKILLKRR